MLTRTHAVALGTTLAVLAVLAPAPPSGATRSSSPANHPDGPSIAMPARPGASGADASGEPDAPPAIQHAAGGAIHALAVHGTLAYVGLGPRLAVLDIADPAAARLLGVTPALPGRVAGVHVAGAYAYAVTPAGLHAVAVSNLAAPRAVSSLALPGPAAVHGARDRLYVAGHGLHVVDATDPAAPALATTLDPERVLTAVAVAAERLYFGGPDGLLSIYGLGDPARPTWLAEVRLGGPIAGLVVAGDRVVVAGGVPAGRGLVVVDAARPDAPRPTGMLLFDHPAYAVAARGDTAYAADASGRWSIVDLARPDGPAVVATVAPEAPAPAGLAPAAGPLAATAGRVYAAADGRLAAWDVRDPAAPARLAVIRAGWPALAVAHHRGRLYVAAGDGGVRAVPADDPAAAPVRDVPAALRDVPAAAPVRDVAVAGDVLLAADAAGDLVVFATTQAPAAEPADPDPAPAAPLLGRLSTGGAVRRVAGAAGRGYALVGDRDVWVVDLADPARPAALGVFRPAEADLPAGEPLTDLAADGTALFLAGARSGVLAVDAADPVRPRVVARIARGGDRARVAGGHLYTWRVDLDLRVFDVRDPAAPAEVGRWTDPAWRLHDLAVDGPVAYAVAVEEPAVPPADPAAAPVRGLWRLDVSAPAAPRVAGTRPWPLDAVAVAVAAGGRAAVAAGADGLAVAGPAAAAPPPPYRLYLPALPGGPEPEKPPVIRRAWLWANANAPADRLRLRVLAGPAEGGAGLALGDDRHRFVLRPLAAPSDPRLAVAAAAGALGIAWGIDDVDGDGRAELWDVAADGEAWRRGLAAGDPPSVLGRLALDDGARVRAAVVADLFGDGRMVLVALVAPPPSPLGPPRERWWLQAWRLPALAPAWRFGIDGVPAGLASEHLLVAQVDPDPAREVVVSFPGSRRPGAAFAHGWVVDPARSAAQWTLPDGFGAHLAAADLDGDGFDEIVGTPFEPSGAVVAAYDGATGAERWRAPRAPAALAAGDVTGDGAAEVVVGSVWGGVAVLDGATGAVRRDVRDPSLSGAIRGLVVGDLDDAPGPEIGWPFQPADAAVGRLVMLADGAALPTDLTARHAGPYRPAVLRPSAAAPPVVLAFPQGDVPADDAGWVRWLALDGPVGAERPPLALPLEIAPGGAPADGRSDAGAPLSVELDADRWPELAVGWGDDLVVLDHDGTLRVRRALAADGLEAPRPVGLGDTDGDGAVELVVAARGAVAGLDPADLAPRWRIALAAGAGAGDGAEVTVGDLDGDAAAEVAVAVFGKDVEVWGGRGPTRRAVLAATAWSADALVVASPRPGDLPALGVVLDGRLTWFDADGTPGAAVDLRPWDETGRLALVPRPGAPPWLVVSGGGGLHVYARYAEAGDDRPAASLDLGAPVRWLAVADIGGAADGAPALLAGLDDGVQAFRIHP